MIGNICGFLLIFPVLKVALCEFIIPDVILEAYEPSGLRVSIPALEGIQFFAFHGNVNKDIAQSEVGEYKGEIRTAVENLWTYFNPNVTLKVGDTVNYWVFIQYQKLGYRRDKQAWKVTELRPLSNTACVKSETVLMGATIVCKNSVIFEDYFNGSSIDSKKWLVEHFIPQSPDFEYVSYQNNPDVVNVNEGWFIIQPKAALTDGEVRGELDLRPQCTRNSIDECQYIQNGVFILPPVVSGRVVALLQFRYGIIEVKARLPTGDWIYPQIYLEQVSEPKNKIYIAYARGNEQLLSETGDDIGAKLLFGGPVLDPKEPARSTLLRTNRHPLPFTSEMHTYAVKWSKDVISLSVDGIQYGILTPREVRDLKFAENDYVRLVLGVGVGGINDFPDNFKSGDFYKPWQNTARTQIKDFFSRRTEWSKTWKSPLQVDHVKITSLP